MTSRIGYDLELFTKTVTRRLPLELISRKWIVNLLINVKGGVEIGHGRVLEKGLDLNDYRLMSGSQPSDARTKKGFRKATSLADEGAGRGDGVATKFGR